MATNLTTVASVKLYLGLTDASYDPILTLLVSQVSRRIEIDCQRVFGAANYVEFYNTGQGQRRIQVRNKPIIQVNSVRWGVGTAIFVNYSGSAIYAGAQLTPARNIILTTISTAGTSTSTINLADTTGAYTTCSQVVSAINAVSGFSATLNGNVDVPTQWLFDTAGMAIKTAAASYVMSFSWPNVDMFTYFVDPTYSVISFAPLTAADWLFEGGPPLGFPSMTQGLCVDYRGGYETIPDDLQLLANMVVADVFNSSFRDQGLQQEQLGDYSYQLIDPMLKRQVYADMLAAYRRIPIAGGMG